MTCDEKVEEKPRRGPSNLTISWSGIIAVAGLLASGVATYNTVQNDISSIKRGEQYQQETNQRLGDEIKAARAEHRETMREFNEKLDRIIQHWPRGGR
jgi:hypothetical protein